MRTRLITVLAIIAAAASAQVRVTPDLAAHMEEVAASELVPVLVVMEDRLAQDELMALTDGLTRAERRLVVERELSRFAERSQADIRDYLADRAAVGTATDINPLWLINAVAAKADRATILGLATTPGVSFVAWDKDVPVESLMDVPAGPLPAGREIAWNVTKVNADDVWGAGYDGTGVIVCVCDGGVNYNHNDLKDHMWESATYPNHGRNFSSGDPNATLDNDGHGTHVAGTVASDGTAGSQCGMAPNATIMIAKLGNGESTWFAAWQWAISEGADVLTQSWSAKYPSNPLYSQHRQASEGILAAGVFHANSTGNQGGYANYPIPFNIPAPANSPPPWLDPNQTLTGGLAGTIGVGATDSNDILASYSGRGPSTWKGSLHPNIPPYNDYWWNPEMGLLKPDIIAPGLSIKSCDYGNVNGYTVMSGTSMATPCVAGCMALLVDYDGTLTPAEMDQAIEESAVDLGTTPGKENDYGSGRIDVYAALAYLGGTSGMDLKDFRAAAYGAGVRVRWDCEGGKYAGFNLYRGDTARTERGKLNPRPITGRGPFVFDDKGVTAGRTYRYWLEVVSASGTAQLFGPVEATAGAKEAYAFALKPSYPNPARGTVTIAYSLPAAGGEYSLAVYDLTGRKVRVLASGAAAPGEFKATWDLTDGAGAAVAPGVYIYRLQTEGASAASRLVVTR